jgi:hypothetical protein
MSFGLAVGDGAGIAAKEGEKEYRGGHRQATPGYRRLDAATGPPARLGGRHRDDNCGAWPATTHERCAPKKMGGRHDDKGDDGFPTSHKMEFLKYDGVGDPMSWLNWCECYF